jgi:D-ribose pyranose/furanose isomerase RbsD
MNLIEENVNAISSSDLTTRELFAKEVQSPCIANLKTMIDATVESSGYAISNCISDSDGVSNPAFRSFYQIFDVKEREFNMEPIILTNAFSGQNIFTQSRNVVNRAQNQFNAKVTTFDGFMSEISQKLNEVTGIYEQQIVILDFCIKSIDSFVKSEVKRISKQLSICQKFNQN